MRMFGTIKTGLLSLLLVVAVGIGTGSDANAQSRREARQLAERLDTIVRQLRAVQQRVIEHQDTHDNTSAGESSVDGGLVADMEVRLGSIDRELRNLTGQIEEIMHRQRQIEQQLTRMQADFEMRFQDLCLVCGGEPRCSQQQHEN